MNGHFRYPKKFGHERVKSKAWHKASSYGENLEYDDRKFLNKIDPDKLCEKSREIYEELLSWAGRNDPLLGKLRDIRKRCACRGFTYPQYVQPLDCSPDQIQEQEDALFLQYFDFNPNITRLALAQFDIIESWKKKDCRKRAAEMLSLYVPEGKRFRSSLPPSSDTCEYCKKYNTGLDLHASSCRPELKICYDCYAHEQLKGKLPDQPKWLKGKFRQPNPKPKISAPRMEKFGVRSRFKVIEKFTVSDDPPVPHNLEEEIVYEVKATHPGGGIKVNRLYVDPWPNDTLILEKHYEKLQPTREGRTQYKGVGWKQRVAGEVEYIGRIRRSNINKGKEIRIPNKRNHKTKIKYSTALECAHAVNKRCDTLNIPRYNPDIERDKPRQSSYTNVYWSLKHKKWEARMRKGKGRLVGRYDTELDAAHAVNRRCDTVNIRRRNPSLGDPPEVEHSVTNEDINEQPKKAPSMTHPTVNTQESETIKGSDSAVELPLSESHQDDKEK